MSSSEIARHAAIDMQQRQLQQDGYTSDINVLLQSLMIDDRNVKYILTGEIQEPLNSLKQLVMDYQTLERIDDGRAARLTELLNVINNNLVKFRRLLPYTLLTSHLMRLTWLDTKEAERLKRRVSIMIRRDILDIDEEELELTDVNFFEALKMMCWNAIDDSIDGFKLRAVTEQKKILTTEFREPKRKKKWGIL